MSNKTYVSIETKICPICGVAHSHNTFVLLDKRIRNTLDPKTCTGYALCEEHQSLLDEGYIALIGANNDSNSDTVKMEEADRTGSLVHLKHNVFNDMFNMELPDSTPFIFVEEQVIEMLKELNNESNN